jgi:CBS domain-containing protein
MKASDLMSHDVECATEQMSLQDAASLMADHDVGLLPVVDDQQKVIGVITDRDIVCRAVAQGRNPLELTVADAMSHGEIWSVSPDTEIDRLTAMMEEHQVRRVPVVDSSGKCCGIVAQADIARQGSDSQTADMVQAVSRPR